jgi:hypothetical protein
MYDRGAVCLSTENHFLDPLGEERFHVVQILVDACCTDRHSVSDNFRLRLIWAAIFSFFKSTGCFSTNEIGVLIIRLNSFSADDGRFLPEYF